MAYNMELEIAKELDVCDSSRFSQLPPFALHSLQYSISFVYFYLFIFLSHWYCSVYCLGHQNIDTSLATFCICHQGFVELTLALQTEYLRQVKLNCKQCRVYRITLNDDMETTFSYCDPTQDIMQGSSK